MPGVPGDAAGGAGGASPAERIEAAIPLAVRDVLATFWAAGYAAYAVGGGLRDILTGRPTDEWDLATAALPEVTAGLFEDAAYENRFGTVGVIRDGVEYEITTFRTDHDYADFRRPHRVEFGESIELDLARRDFTMNALAWGSEGRGDGDGGAARLIDPFDGVGDIGRRLIRAVGEPAKRFGEDALRIVRAIRFATTLGWEIEPETLAAIPATAPLVGHLSGERIAAELTRILASSRPSIGLRLLADTGVLVAISPELAAQRGVGQNKVAGEDLWDHTVRTVDAAAAAGASDLVRLAALVHDIGKPATAADGHFFGHDAVGAELAGAWLDRLHVSTATRERVERLVRLHMFRYEPAWGDSAVRRFLSKVGPDLVDDLLTLREADNVGSGQPPNADDLDALRARIAAELEAGPILDRSALAVDGSDLMRELGWPAGPRLGAVLGALFERVVDDPSLNERDRLLTLARELAERRADQADPPDRRE